VGSLLNGAELQDFRGAEVGDFYSVVAGEHQVRGLDVAMHDVALVSELEGAAGLFHDAQNAGQGKGVTIVEERLEAAALYEFHGDVVEAVFFAGIENDHDIGMGQKTGGARFRLKSGEKLGASKAGAFGAELDGFDSDGAADDGVRSLVDDTHGTAAQFTDDFVTSGLRKRGHRYVRHGRSALCPLTSVSERETTPHRCDRAHGYAHL